MKQWLLLALLLALATQAKSRSLPTSRRCETPLFSRFMDNESNEVLVTR